MVSSRRELLEAERCVLTINKARISLIQGDITKQPTDSIVNAANSSLLGGGGVDGAIHRVGGPVILEQCKQIVAKQGRLPPGKAVITTGGRLKAKWVIHTVGPIWQGGKTFEAETLASAYRESLRIASHYGLQSIAFPSISTGAYGYPIPDAARVALQTVSHFLTEQSSSLKEVTFVLFDARTYDTYSTALRELTNEKPG